VREKARVRESERETGNGGAAQGGRRVWWQWVQRKEIERARERARGRSYRGTSAGKKKGSRNLNPK